MNLLDLAIHVNLVILRSDSGESGDSGDSGETGKKVAGVSKQQVT